MTSLPSVCCTSAFLHDHKKLLKSHKAAVLAARRTTSHSFATWRHRHTRRARSQPSTLFTPIRRRRPRPFAADCRSLQQLSEEQIQFYNRSASPVDMAARRPSTADRRQTNPSSGYDGSDTLSNEGKPAENEAMTSTSASMSRSTRRNRHSIAVMPSCPPIDDAPEMSPPPTPADDAVTRASRSTSSASRNTNRLSITLPIAPPTSDPSRPISAATAHHPSLPGTPARPTTSSAMSPPTANELIIAIAAQERRVMELREELGRAEDDLKRVKRQWTMHEAYRKPDGRAAEQGVGDDEGVRRSADMDRRRMLLQQQNATRERKRVFQGRHVRTLSLLSPTKAPEEPFPALGDKEVERAVPEPDPEQPAIVRRQAALNKRATWQPQRSSHTHAHSTSLSMSASPGSPYGPNNNPMSQIVEDFKLGFRTFYEDIRQITVGDEPVNGGAPARPGPGQRAHTDDGDTIRPAAPPRPKLAAAFDPEPETPSKKAGAAQKETSARARNKRFSWTPLSFEGIDGDAWLTFDTPASAGKSTRWSGSTMNEEEDKGVEVESPLVTKAAQVTSPGPLSPQKLEELTASVVNRLSPSSIRRTAEEYMTQWEQSMAEVAVESKESREAREAREAREGGEGKENASVLA